MNYVLVIIVLGTKYSDFFILPAKERVAWKKAANKTLCYKTPRTKLANFETATFSFEK